METRVIVCLNPFKRDKNLIETVAFEPIESLQHFKDEYFEKDVDVITILNGEIIPSEKLPLTFPADKSEIIFTPFVGLPAIMAYLIENWVALTIKLVIGLVLSFGLAMLMSLLSPKPDVSGADDQPYGWSQFTKQQTGTPLPEYYGVNLVTGNVFVAFTDSNWTDAKKNFQDLSMLIGMGRGPIQNIYQPQLNNRDILDYDQTEMARQIHLGTINQLPDPNFKKIVTEIKYDFEITSSTIWEYFETDPADVFSSIEINFNYPRGVYRMTDTGGIASLTIDMYVEYKRDGDGEDWVACPVLDVSGHYTAVQYRTLFITGLLGGRYFLRMKRQRAKWTLSDATPLDDDKTAASQDEVRVDSIRTVDQTILSYPQTAYLSIKLKATDQISGSVNFQCMVQGRIIQVYDGVKWTLEYSTNPAWVCLDILTQPCIVGDGVTVPFSINRYDGFDISQIDVDMFLEWANWCDDLVQGENRRCEFNGVFDADTSMWEAAMQVCLIGRAVLIWQGIKVTIMYEHPMEPVQLFSVGNLGVSSFKKQWTSKEQRANVIEAEFMDELQQYQRTVLSVISNDVGSENQILRMAFFGLTNESQVIRLAKFFLLQNQYCLYSVSWEADIEAINCSIGDVVWIQHPMCDWGTGAKGGLVVSDSTLNTKILLDSICTIDPSYPTSFMLYIRFADGTLEMQQVLSVTPVGTTQTLVTTASFSQIPKQYDRYIFGNGKIYTERQKVKISDIELGDDGKVKLTGIQYDPRIYTCDDLLANFTANIYHGNDPLTVTFQDASGGNDIDYWEWDFGDGSAKSYVQNPPAHVYGAGSFDVQLTVRQGTLTSTTIKQGFIIVYPVAKVPTAVSGLQLWLDAIGSAFSLTSSLYVDKWNDISGNNRHAFPSPAGSTGTDRPSKTTLNGKPVVYFPAAPTYKHLQLTGIMGSSLMDQSQGITMMIVSMNDGTVNDRQGAFISSDIAVGSTASYPVFQGANNRWAGIESILYTLDINGGGIVPFPVDKNLNVLTIVVKPGQFVKVYRNGVIISTYYGAVAIQPATGLVHIGANSLVDINKLRWDFKGYIHSMCVWNKALTDSERMGVETYFAQVSQYNITAYSNWIPSQIPNLLGWWNCFTSKKKFSTYTSVWYSQGYNNYIVNLYNMIIGKSTLQCDNSSPDLPILVATPTPLFRGSTYLDFASATSAAYLKSLDFYPNEPCYPITVFMIFGYAGNDSPLFYVADSETAINFKGGKVELKTGLINTKNLVSGQFYYLMAYLNGYSGTSIIKVNGVIVTGVASLDTYIEYLKMSGSFRFIDMIIAQGDATSYEAQVQAYYSKMTGGYDFTV